MEPEMNPEKALNNNRLSNRYDSVERERNKLAAEEEDGKASLPWRKWRTLRSTRPSSSPRALKKTPS